MGGGTQIKETPQQKALAERAQQQYADYRQRWAPLQQKLISQIQSSGAADSADRKMAQGRMATEVQAKFDQARTGLESALTNKGAGPGSSKFNLAETGLTSDAATSAALNESNADRAVTANYIKGLTNIAAMGKGERAEANSGLAQQASMSAKQAEQDAALASQERAGMYQMGGTALGAAAGYGLGGGGGSGGGGAAGMGGGSGLRAGSDSLMPNFGTY